MIRDCSSLQSYSPIFKNVEMKPVSTGIASSEKDGLAGADLYSFHRYYGPFRHPIQPSLFLADLWLGSCFPLHRASRVDFLILRTHTIATTPVLPVGARVARFPTGRRPSPCSQRLSSHINVFEAFSAFSFHYG